MRTPGIAVSVVAVSKRMARARAAAARLCVIASSVRRVVGVVGVDDELQQRPALGDARAGPLGAHRAQHVTHQFDLGHFGERFGGCFRPAGHVDRRRVLVARVHVLVQLLGDERKERRVEAEQRAQGLPQRRPGGCPLLVRVAVLGPEPVLDEFDVVVAELRPEELVERFPRDRVVVRLEPALDRGEQALQAADDPAIFRRCDRRAARCVPVRSPARTARRGA